MERRDGSNFSKDSCKLAYNRVGVKAATTMRWGKAPYGKIIFIIAKLYYLSPVAISAWTGFSP